MEKRRCIGLYAVYKYAKHRMIVPAARFFGAGAENCPQRRGAAGGCSGGGVEKYAVLWKADAVIHMRIHARFSLGSRQNRDYPQHPQLYGYYVYFTLNYSSTSFFSAADNETCAARNYLKRVRKNPLPEGVGKGYVFGADVGNLPMMRGMVIDMLQRLRPARVRRRNAQGLAIHCRTTR